MLFPSKAYSLHYYSIDIYMLFQPILSITIFNRKTRKVVFLSVCPFHTEGTHVAGFSASSCRKRAATLIEKNDLGLVPDGSI